ncbi:MAG: AmmeMemoRadiSam system protein A [Thermodesulfobacteriota bacterium]
MSKEFEFSLSSEEKKFLKRLARLSIEKQFQQDIELPEVPSSKLQEHYGAFVTLKKQGQLRGCIGNVLGDRPVWQAVSQMAVQAALNDPRFPPLSRQELDEVEIEISILSPMQQCTDLEQIQPGRHGLMVQKGMHSGLLLPQVATEQGWDKETFLSQTCLKAGLPPNAWQGKKIQIFCFEAEIF